MKKKLTLSMLILLFVFGAMAQDPITAKLSIVATPLTTGDLPMTAGGQQIWGDYDNDADLDIFIISGQGTPFSALYKNNGNGTYTEIVTDVTMLALSSAVFFDYDNDGNLDLLICGSTDGTNTAVITELYHNTGAPNYTLELNDKADFVGISAEGGDNSTRLLEVVDYNNDGWLDVFMSGNAGGTWDVSGNSRVVALYKNDKGTFKLQTTPVGGSANFTSMNGGGIHCSDVNNDGFADMIVSGYVDGDVQTVTDLYFNNGDGTFTYYANSRTVFTGHTQGETVFADVNNDGWMDIVEFGRDVNNGWANFANLFINNKDKTFVKSGGSNLVGGGAVVAVGDINNDGWVDLAASGWGPNMSFFYNKGDNTFLASAIDPDKARARAGCINFVDFNKDGSLDFTIFGYRDGGDGTAENPTWPDYLLTNNLNTGIAANTAPTTPTNFTVTQSGADVVLAWTASTDDHTPTNGLRYNVYAKPISGTGVYTYFPANIETGMLKANGVRPLISGTSIKLFGFASNDYYLGVQAVDNANLASPFVKLTYTSIRNKANELETLVYSYNDRLFIQNNEPTQIRYKVMSINGQELKYGVCEANGREELQIATTGVYIVQLITDRASKVTKVVIK